MTYKPDLFTDPSIITDLEIPGEVDFDPSANEHTATDWRSEDSEKSWANRVGDKCRFKNKMLHDEP